MLSLTAQELAQATGGRLLQEGCRAITKGLTTDTRRLQTGCIFLALVGDRFDANSFAQQAAEAGAAALVLSDPQAAQNIPPSCSVVLVQDSLLALQQLASWWRTQLEPLTVIGLTGSCGKTSTKDMLAAILKQSMPSEATLGNLNNHIGVPLSILHAEPHLQAVVWEMGTNHMGEIAPLCAMTRPQLGIITNIGTAHIEYMGTRENIAHEKCSLARALPANGAIIYPAQDDFAERIAQDCAGLAIPVGAADSCVRAANICMGNTGSHYQLIIDALGSIDIQLPVPGEHMISNSLLAAAAAWKAGSSLEHIAAGLRGSKLTHGRLCVHQVDNITLVDDSYNANLESMKSALHTVAAMPLDAGAKRIALLGKMGELGAFSLQAHAEVGQSMNSLPYQLLITVGDDDNAELQNIRQHAPSIQCLHANTHQEAADTLRPLLSAGDIVLFQGSRSAAMERCLHLLDPQLNN